MGTRCDCGRRSRMRLECGRCHALGCERCMEKGMNASGAWWIRCRVCLATGDNPEDRVDYQMGMAK